MSAPRALDKLAAPWHDIALVTSKAPAASHLHELAKLRRVRDRMDREYTRPLDVEALGAALDQIGVPYAWGGGSVTGPSAGLGIDADVVGFDCSGLVQWAYAKAGVQLPRVTDAQFAAGNGEPVDRGKLLPGDLVFFGKPGNIYHVGISMGGDKFLHAPKTGDVVKVASLSDSYYSQNFAGGRRFEIARAYVWNLVDAHGRRHGHAASFAEWRYL